METINDLCLRLGLRNEALLSEEDLKAASEDINNKMRIFDMEQRAYFAQSIESARHAYFNF